MMCKIEECLVQTEQRLAKVDTPLDMAEGISNQLQRLMNERDDASNNFEYGHKGGGHHTHQENHMHLQQHGTLAEFNDEFDATSCKLCSSEEYLVGAYMAGFQEEYTTPVHFIQAKNHERSSQLGTYAKNHASTVGYKENVNQEHGFWVC